MEIWGVTLWTLLYVVKNLNVLFLVRHLHVKGGKYIVADNNMYACSIPHQVCQYSSSLMFCRNAEQQIILWRPSFLLIWSCSLTYRYLYILNSISTEKCGFLQEPIQLELDNSSSDDSPVSQKFVSLKGVAGIHQMGGSHCSTGTVYQFYNTFHFQDIC